jgi:hypothetical protein
MSNELHSKTSESGFIAYLKENHIPILNLVLTIFLFFAGYYFIGQFSVNKDKSETDLSKRNIELAEIELKTKELKNNIDIVLNQSKTLESVQQIELNKLNTQLIRIDVENKKRDSELEYEIKKFDKELKEASAKFDVNTKKVNITSDTIKLIDDLHPKLIVAAQENKHFIDKESKSITLFFKLTNSGRFTILSTVPEFKIYLIDEQDSAQIALMDSQKIYKFIQNKKSLEVDKEFSFQPFGTFHGPLFSGQTREFQLIFRLKNIPKNREFLLFIVTFNSETIHNVSDVILPHIKDLIPGERLQDYTKLSFDYVVPVYF